MVRVDCFRVMASQAPALVKTGVPAQWSLPGATVQDPRARKITDDVDSDHRERGAAKQNPLTHLIPRPTGRNVFRPGTFPSRPTSSRVVGRRKKPTEKKRPAKAKKLGKACHRKVNIYPPILL